MMDLSNPEKNKIGRIFTDNSDGLIENLVDINKNYGTPDVRGNSVLNDYPEAKVPRVKNPDQLVTIYRSANKEASSIEPGDWVSFNKEYANSHDRGKLISIKVPAKDVIWAQGDMHEWIYSPENIRKQYPNGLTDIWNKANKK